MKSSDAAVVQVFVQSALFDWLEPYKAPTQLGACGTAFFIDAQGHLLTNYHVVAEAASIQIQAPSCGKERFDLEVVGVYPERDIALLRLTAPSREKFVQAAGAIPYLELGSSDALPRGATVTTLGYPLGQEMLKVTQGIMSGYQELSGEAFLQITAPLNEGNSGGPCLDEAGRVVGINTAIILEAQGIGYALPISDLIAVIRALRSTKLLHRPVLGCDFNYASPDMLAYLGNPQPGGVYINRVYRLSSLEAAGVQEGDMLCELNGHELDLYGDIKVDWNDEKVHFTSLLQRVDIGQQVELVLYRRGKRLEKSFAFGSCQSLPIRLLYPELEKIEYEIIGGMVVMELTLNHVNLLEEHTPEFSFYRLRANQYQSQLVLTQLLQNSAFDNARVLEVGDVIAAVNEQPVGNLADFRHACAGMDRFLSVKTKTGKLSVVAIKDVLHDEERLAAQYHYEPTSVMKSLAGYWQGKSQGI